MRVTRISGLLVLKVGHKSKERKSSAKERQESPSSLISKVRLKSKRKLRKRESSTDSSSSKEVSPEVTLHPAKKKNMVRGEDKIILHLLGIHPHLMEMIQMTRNIRGLK